MRRVYHPRGSVYSGRVEIRIAALIRLWNAARVLEHLGGQGSEDGARLWGAHELRLLDVRAQGDFERRHIPESVCIPANEIGGRVYELCPKWRPLIVIADAPQEAGGVAERLRERGWLAATPLSASLADWPGPWESGPARRTLWEATPVVRRWASRIPRGRILDLGSGSGRDAVYLALLGHDVTAVDVLPDALRMAARLAARMGATLRTQELDLRHGAPAASGDCAAILMIRFLNRELFSWIREALLPGGLFLLETYGGDPDAPGLPRAPKLRLEPQEALRAFGRPARAAGTRADGADFEILEYLEMPDSAEHSIARLVARRMPRGVAGA